MEYDPSGGQFVSDSPLASIVVSSGGFTYIAEAKPGTAAAAAEWRVQRVDATGSTVWADGNDNFDNVATNLPGLSYS